MDIRVVIICSDELEIVTVDGIEMEDISSIKSKPIQEWFLPSNGRDGWEGLIKEIKKMVDDENANLNFEFQGPKESKHIFEKTIAQYGYGTEADGLSKDDVARRNLEEAKKAEHRGLYKKALTHFIKAAEFGESVEALFQVAEYYFDFEEKHLDCEKEEAITNAIDYYEKAANRGHTLAQHRLYEIFSTDFYVNEDRKQALMWLKQVADSGDDNAQIELGDELYNEWTFDEDDEDSKEALKWYRKAAKKHNNVAYMRIARCYRWGNGVHEDFNKAFEWYEKAAKAGNIRGIFQCAECYYHGRGVEENGDKAFELYSKAADEGEADACYMVGKCYEYGYGVEENLEKAFEWFLKSAQNDYLDGQAEVGYRYDIGIGVERDPDEAVRWYSLAAEGGEAWSQCNLGYMYESGDAGKIDYKKAEEWYLEAAQQDYVRAQNNLASLYEQGKVGEADTVKAYEWYAKAAENDDARGQYNLGRCYDFGIGVEKDYAKAIEWYNKAINNGNVASMYMLGQCYEYGTGVKKDMEIAFQWYKKAADAENPDANACFKIAEAYYAQKDPRAAGRASAMLAVSVLIPVTNLIAIPAAIIGGVLSSANQNKKFLKTEAGKDMMKYYRRAAALGHSEAEKRVKQLEQYEK